METVQTQQGAEQFFAALGSVCRRGKCEEYALISLDYDNFNYINDLFGYAVGDQVLAGLAESFRANLGPGEYFSHLHADQFSFLLRYRTEGELVERMLRISDPQEGARGALPPNYRLICSGGVLPLRGRSSNPMLLLDFANFARKRAKGNHRSTILIYDDELLREQQWVKLVTANMEPALRAGEFHVFFQPKVQLSTGSTIGAEALVRWRSREMGFVEPDYFLPIMEQNGFVTRLDFSVLDQVCCFLRESIDQQRAVVPISVNFSKRHTGDPTFAKRVAEVVDSYELPHRLIEVEITEYSSSRSYQALIDTVIQVKQNGFKISMDDFGRGYSTLSDLKNLPLDAVKFDRVFLLDGPGGTQGRQILAKLVEMVKSLGLQCVVEGVEETEQAEFLFQLGCDIGQGYHFSRPIDRGSYEAFLLSHPLASPEGGGGERNCQSITHEFQLDTWEQYSLGKTIEMGLMKGRLDQELHIHFANDAALQYLGRSREEFFLHCHNSLLAAVLPEDVEKLRKLAGKLSERRNTLEFQLRVPGRGNRPRTLRGKITYVMDKTGARYGLYAFRDITRELEQTSGLQRSLDEATAAEKESQELHRIQEERYRIAFELSDSSLFDWDFEKDYITFSEKHYEMLGRRTEQHNVSSNPEIRKGVHPDDLPVFETWVAETFRRPGVQQAQYRLMDGAGNYLWYRVRSTTICDSTGKPLRAVGSFSNIHNQQQTIDKLRLRAQIDPLTQVLNKEEFRQQAERALGQESAYGYAFFMVDVDAFKVINDKMGHLFGDVVLQRVAEKLVQLFPEESLVGRLGGDEFAALLRLDTGGRAEALLRAQQLLRGMHEVFGGGENCNGLSVSIGIATAPDQGRRYDEVYHLADLAMYASKQRGKNRFTLYDPELAQSQADCPIK